jgi:HlyD family secretion protein
LQIVRHVAGTVDQIRKTPQTQQNVVTYTVVVRAANPDLLLLPGMTASARFIIDRRSDAIIAPSAALRFTPPGRDVPSGQHVWVADGDDLRPVPVVRGLTDEARSEVVGEGLAAGTPVVVGIERVPPDRTSGRLLIGGF